MPKEVKKTQTLSSFWLFFSPLCQEAPVRVPDNKLGEVQPCIGCLPRPSSMHCAAGVTTCCLCIEIHLSPTLLHFLAPCECVFCCGEKREMVFVSFSVFLCSNSGLHYQCVVLTDNTHTTHFYIPDEPPDPRTFFDFFFCLPALPPPPQETSQIYHVLVMKDSDDPCMPLCRRVLPALIGDWQPQAAQPAPPSHRDGPLSPVEARPLLVGCFFPLSVRRAHSPVVVCLSAGTRHSSF